MTTLASTTSLEKKKSIRPASDFYPTPPEAVHALLRAENFTTPVWECACGDGAISRVFESEGISVVSTDLNPHGYGQTSVDFLLENRLLAPCIVTNPPYRLADYFVRKALDLGAEKIVFLLRLAYLEGQGRSDIIDHSGLVRVHVFRDRVTMYPKGIEKTGTSTTAYAWFVWERGYKGPATIHRITAVERGAQPCLKQK